MEITVREVRTRREKLDFLNFPLDLYRDNPCFVPPLWSDEKKIFDKDYVYGDTCEAVYYNAYAEGKIVGRISGILQRASNEKRGEKRVRFTRFDAINDPAVAEALFGAVERWALEKGMDTVCGPLGFSDLEREGLLIEGFDQLSTFEEQYNADYYPALIEHCGYVGEADWNESKLRAPKEKEAGEELKKLSEFIMKRYDLHFGEAKNTRDFLNRYAKGFFEMIDKTYADIYGTVPFTDGMRKMMIDNFKLIIDLRHVAVILDKDGNIVCFGICFPSIAEAVQKSRGHLTPAALVRLLRAIKKPRVIDLGLVGVDPAYANRGISTAISAALIDMLTEGGVEYAETNLNLVDNAAIQNQWKRFDREIHKRRRAYVKRLV